MASDLIRDLVELIGHARTIELLRGWGGRRVKVPVEVHQDHALVFTVGWDAANCLSRAYGGTDLDLPAERNHLIELRNDAILTAFRAGRSITWLSLNYGLSRRHVGSVLDAMGAETERQARATAGTRI